MIILEFAGLPGCGKSTICGKLQKELEHEGYSVINLHNIMPGNNVVHKIKRKVFTQCAVHTPLNKKLKRLLLSINTKYDESEWILDFLLLNYSIHKNSKTYDVILLDEGFIQYYTSLYHGMQVSSDSEIKLVFEVLCEEYRKHVQVYFLEINNETALQRIKVRNRAGDRFLTECDEESLALLEQKRQNLSNTLLAWPVSTKQFNVDSAAETELNRLIQEISRYI